MLNKLRKHMQSPLSGLGTCLLLLFMALVLAGIFCVATAQYLWAAIFLTPPILLIMAAFFDEVKITPGIFWKIFVIISGLCGVAYLIYIGSFFAL